GLALADKDDIMSMSILNGADTNTEERDVYMKLKNTERRLQNEGKDPSFTDICTEAAASLEENRYRALQQQEQFILTVTDRGFGKRTSSYEYRQANRGGQGIAAMDLTSKTGNMVAAYPITEADNIMMVSDQGQIIR